MVARDEPSGVIALWRRATHPQDLTGTEPGSAVKPVIIPQFIDLDTSATVGRLNFQRHGRAGKEASRHSRPDGAGARGEPKSKSKTKKRKEKKRLKKGERNREGSWGTGGGDHEMMKESAEGTIGSRST